MAAIKVQSIGDIVKAYLSCLGYDEKRAKAVLPLIEVKGDDVIAFIDKLILKKAKEIFANKKMDDEQIIGLFKFCFISIDAAKKWPKAIFEHNDEFAKEMNANVPNVVPNMMVSKMQPQKIESHTIASALKRIFGRLIGK